MSNQVGSCQLAARSIGVNVNVIDGLGTGFFDNTGTSFDDTIQTKVVLSITPAATAVPTPVLLPGLIGMGVAELRKRKQEKVEAEA